MKPITVSTRFHILLVGSAYLDERYRRVAEGLAGEPCDIHRCRTDAEFAAAAAAADVILVDRHLVCGRDIMEKSPRLRAVISPIAGIEQIDLKAASELGIIVGRGQTPENTQGMAECTVLLMLAAIYDLHGLEQVLRNGVARPTWPPGRLLKGKTIGLIGFGKIARGVCERLTPWGVAIKVHSRYPLDYSAPCVNACSLEELLATSDVVSLHTTLRPDTRHLINAERLRQMKRGVILINTSRAGLVDEAALVAAVKQGIVGKVALDALDPVPLPANSPLRELPDAILTPHMLGHTQEGALNFIATAIESIRRVLRGEPPVYVCNPEFVEAWRSRWSKGG
jgi:phosphoglycerate dehydrogenase-like enzyme